MPGGDHFAVYKKFLAAISTLHFTTTPLTSKASLYFLSSTPYILPTATKHFDEGVSEKENAVGLGWLTCLRKLKGGISGDRVSNHLIQGDLLTKHPLIQV